ncbi:toprim domain-containing protein [Streptomyces sp. DH10]|uniref:toprim domain-containing protein n=1 Tax=Streptomyces sp. DH10 TaxID=3040121 RepID=UPI00244231AC|nr:toprim domain-containing protein [Streptomyces sp. DH10]MDG9711130.1 toprim domain-containing protein [Streptomyces sp. DH10]
MTSIVPEPALRSFLEEATARYEAALHGPAGIHAEEYLTNRGLSEDSVRSLRLGYVENPLPGHESAHGYISVPYLTRAGIVSVRFRRIGDGEGPKYRSVPGDPPRIYNANALLEPSDFIAICEGEFDTAITRQVGIPAVGIAGVSAWKDYFARCFKGYKAVYILADADDKGQGMEFAEKVAPQINNARISPMPGGHDVNSFFLESGGAALLDRLEIKK